jgi:hypothetical protein
MELPDSFFKADPLGRSGFCEWSFMSTTEDYKVAVQYSGVVEKRPVPTVMVMCTSAVDRGACIQEYSQHPQVVMPRAVHDVIDYRECGVPAC